MSFIAKCDTDTPSHGGKTNYIVTAPVAYMLLGKLQLHIVRLFAKGNIKCIFSGIFRAACLKENAKMKHT